MTLRPLPFLSALSVGLMAGAPSSLDAASLAWDRTHQHHEARLTDTGARAVFWFTNVTSQPVTLQKVRPACPCTTAEASRSRVGPGQSGSVEVDFTFGFRIGPQRQHVRVYLEGADEADATLTFDVVIPQLLLIQPAIAVWEQGSAPTPQRLAIRAGVAEAIDITEIVCTNELFHAELDTARAPQATELVVTPRSTERTQLSSLEVRAKSESGVEKSYPVQLLIHQAAFESKESP